MTSLSDWLGTSDHSGVSMMGLDGHDLESQTLAMTRRAEQLQTESELLDDQLGELSKLVKDGVGEGTAERGAVTVRVDANHRVTDIQLTPKAIHLGSTERLRKALLDALDAACDDISGQLEEVTGIKGPFSPLDSFIESIPEVAAVLPEDLRRPPKKPRPEQAAAANADQENDA